MNTANVFHLRAQVQEQQGVHFSELLFVIRAARLMKFDESQYSRPLSHLSVSESYARAIVPPSASDAHACHRTMTNVR